MRLLVINWQDARNPRAGGAETHLHEIFARLAARGHPVTVLASGWRGAKQHEIVDGLEIHRVGGRYSYALRAPLYYRRVLRSRPFDLVIEDLNKVPLFVCAWTHRPVVLIAHHLFGNSAFGAAGVPVAAATWALERTLGWAYRRIPVQAVSESTAEDLCRHGFRDQDITVIHNGTTVAHPEFTAYARAAQPTFLYLGRLQAYKRVDLILRAVAALRGRLPSVRLIIAGRGPEERPLRRLARRLGVEHRVTFEGFVTDARKRQLFAMVWANVVTSSKEGWGITVLEAAAAETPTVASCSAGLRDAVRTGTTGILVPHGDVTALADALWRLAENSEYARSLGRAARRLAERSTWDRAADETEAHLSLVAHRVRGAVGNPWRVRRRDQRSPIPLPSNATALVPYGCTWFSETGRWDGWPVRAHVVLGAMDRMGEQPVLALEHVEYIDPTIRAPMTDFEGCVGSVQALDGWPSDPAAFIRAWLHQVLGARWRSPAENGRRNGGRPLLRDRRRRRVDVPFDRRTPVFHNPIQ
jgi:glycosyltransferase involved in cell wall biosynthesis